MGVATEAVPGRGDEVSLVMEIRWTGDLARADCEARQTSPLPTSAFTRTDPRRFSKRRFRRRPSEFRELREQLESAALFSPIERDVTAENLTHAHTVGRHSTEANNIVLDKLTCGFSKEWTLSF